MGKNPSTREMLRSWDPILQWMTTVKQGGPIYGETETISGGLEANLRRSIPLLISLFSPVDFLYKSSMWVILQFSLNCWFDLANSRLIGYFGCWLFNCLWGFYRLNISMWVWFVSSTDGYSDLGISGVWSLVFSHVWVSVKMGVFDLWWNLVIHWDPIICLTE
jgi:hypothetical protein